MNYRSPPHLEVSAEAHGSSCVRTARITSSDRCAHTAFHTIWTSWGHPNTVSMQDTILWIIMLRHGLDQGQDNACQHFPSIRFRGKTTEAPICMSLWQLPTCLPPRTGEVSAFSSLPRHRFSSPVLSALSLTLPTHTHYHTLTLPTQPTGKLTSWHE